MDKPEWIDLEQRSPEWLAWRRNLGMASEAAAMLGISPYFPRTPADLWAVKSGAASVVVTAAMRQGAALEERALEMLQHRVQIGFYPSCYQRGRLGASLDGIDFDGATVAEVKVPAKGSQSPLYQAVQADTVPDHYMAQVQQQLWVSGASSAYFGVYAVDIDDIAFRVVMPDPEWTNRIIAGWRAFWDAADAGTIPPNREQRTDAEWLIVAQAYRDAKANMDAWEMIAERAKARLAELSGGASCEGGGIKYTVSERKGSIDYKAALADIAPGADVEPYRKDGGTVARITVEDEV